MTHLIAVSYVDLWTNLFWSVLMFVGGFLGGYIIGRNHE